MPPLVHFHFCCIHRRGKQLPKQYNELLKTIKVSVNRPKNPEFRFFGFQYFTSLKQSPLDKIFQKVYGLELYRL